MSLPHQHIKDTMRGFLLGSINIPKLNDEANLFELGLINSLFAVQLMTFIEKTFDLEVETEDLDIENFKSLNAATEFVVKKKKTESREPSEIQDAVRSLVLMPWHIC